MSDAADVPTPREWPMSLVVAMVGALVSALALIGIGIAALVSGHAAFSIGIGLMLVVYGLVVGLGGWLAYKHIFLARGLIVAPALLNLATAVSLFGGGDLAQSIGAGVAIVWFAVTVVAALLPSTRRALQRTRS